MAPWRRLPADHELHLLFLGMEPDCISQPPLQLGVALWPNPSQWSRGSREVGHFLAWPVNPPGTVVCALPSLLAGAEAAGAPGGLLPQDGGSVGARASARRRARCWSGTPGWDFTWTSTYLWCLSHDTVCSELASLTDGGMMPGMLGQTGEVSEGAKDLRLCLILIIYVSGNMYWPVNFKNQFTSW